MRVPSAAVTIAWALSIAVLASVIDAETRSFLSSKDMSEVPAAWQILGEARSIVSNMSILQADLYLHGGAGHFFDEHEGGLAIGKSDSHDAHEDHEDHEHHDISHDNGTPAGLFNPLIRIADAVAVTEHKHLSGKEEAEIVPWLYFSARIDPSNTTAYTLTSYWL
ncbi:MAG: hypothetical protein PHT95_08270, partial [Candidatus Omnitrophica bacterium]|nr:hypothetical protein [Candidatus Omnitrophota bacterium]